MRDQTPEIDRRSEPLGRWERFGMWLLLAAMIAFGVVVELRSTVLKRRMTDAGVYFRAAWAMRDGADPYEVTDDNGWHYVYPPFLANVLVPLADPPPGEDRAWTIPYEASVAIWYVIGVGCGLWSIHLLVAALDAARGAELQPGSRWWWYSRTIPLAFAAPMIARTVARGQVNTIVLLCIVLWMVDTLRKREFRAGLWLSGAIAIKVIPAFLVLYPLWRRSGRGLGGVAAGVVATCVLLPLAMQGPTEAWNQAETFVRVVLAPGAGVGDDETRTIELTGASTTDSQSIVSVIHNTRYPDFNTRPAAYDRGERLAHVALFGLLTLTTLLTLGRRNDDPRHELAFMGALLLLMTIGSPVCHMHYFVFATPVIVTMWNGRRPWWAIACLGLFTVTQVLSAFPIPLARQLGPTLYTTLVLWAAIVVRPAAFRLAREEREVDRDADPVPLARAA